MIQFNLKLMVHLILHHGGGGVNALPPPPSFHQDNSNILKLRNKLCKNVKINLKYCLRTTPHLHEKNDNTLLCSSQKGMAGF